MAIWRTPHASRIARCRASRLLPPKRRRAFGGASAPIRRPRPAARIRARQAQWSGCMLIEYQSIGGARTRTQHFNRPAGAERLVAEATGQPCEHARITLRRLDMSAVLE